VLDRAFADLGPRAPDAVDAIVAGLTGFDGASETAGAVADGVRALVRSGRVVVTNDAVTSYLGAIGFEPGAVVAAGSGNMAEGQPACADGRSLEWRGTARAFEPASHVRRSAARFRALALFAMWGRYDSLGPSL